MEENQSQESTKALTSRALYLPRRGTPWTINLSLPSSVTEPDQDTPASPTSLSKVSALSPRPASPTKLSSGTDENPSLAQLDASSYFLSPGESLLRVSYSGINPADFKHRVLGVWDTVPGYDFSGTIIRTLPGSPFVAGDRVGGTAPAGTEGRKPAHGAHQDWLVGVDDMMFRIGTGDVDGKDMDVASEGSSQTINMAEAAGINIPLRTAIVALYAVLDLPLPWELASSLRPSTGVANCKSVDGGILIWGAGSQVGGWAVQLAAASGVTPIYAVAGSRHHEALKRFGATRCFEYEDPVSQEEGLVQRIIAAAQEDKVFLKTAFDAVGYGKGSDITAPTRATDKSQGASDISTEEMASSNSTKPRHMAELCIDVLRSLNSPTYLNPSQESEQHDISKRPLYRVATALPGEPREATIVFALPDRYVKFQIEGETILELERDGEMAELVVLVLEWVVRNYGRPFKVPGEVRVVGWDAAVDELMKIAQGTGGGGEKVVIKHY